MNTAPFEIVGGPMEVFLAPVGEAFPAVDEAPAGNWLELGSSGADDFTEDGVIVTMDQTLGLIRGLKRTGALKARRSSEDFKIGVTVMDGTVEHASILLNGNTITNVPAGVGTVGTDEVGLTRGKCVTEYALLARGESAYVASGFADFQVPRVIVSSSPAPAYKKGEDVAGFETEFTALVDLSAADEFHEFGSLIEKSADELP